MSAILHTLLMLTVGATLGVLALAVVIGGDDRDE